MPPRFDPDTALKKDLLARYKKLVRSHERLKTDSASLSAGLTHEVEKLRAKLSTALQDKSKLHSAQKYNDARLIEEVARLQELTKVQESRIRDLEQGLEAMTDSSSPRTLYRIELKPGLRSSDPDLFLYLDLIVDSSSNRWLGGRSAGYAYNTSYQQIFPIILDNERLDYGSGYEDDRDGRLLIKDREIRAGETIPFFPDGVVDPEGGEIYVVRRIMPLLQGRHMA